MAQELTQLLHAAKDGRPHAAETLLPLVYAELRRLAHAYTAQERGGQTLQATALVHEAWLRLLGPDGEQLSWDSRRHFFAAAAMAMRRILVERARQRRAVKHGGGRQRVELDDVHVASLGGEAEDRTDLVVLDGLLDKLAAYDQRKCDVVMLKYFAGMSNDEAALALGVSPATIRREWTFARAWLMREMELATNEGG